MNDQHKKHDLILENRERLSVSGVEDVTTFDETLVRVKTSLGELTVTGEGLHVENLSVDAGDLLLTGSVTEISYEEIKPRGIFRGLLR